MILFCWTSEFWFCLRGMLTVLLDFLCSWPLMNVIMFCYLLFFSVFCFLWFYRHKIILNSFDLIYNKKRKCFIVIRMSVTYHNKLGSEKCLTHGSTVFCSSRGILWKISYVFHPIRIVSYFFFIWIFFHDHSRITGLQGKKEVIFLSPLYHLHPLHRHLHINQAITAEGSPLYRAGNQTWTGNPLFP